MFKNKNTDCLQTSGINGMVEETNVKLTYLLKNKWPYACCASQSINSCDVDKSWFSRKDLQFL